MAAISAEPTTLRTAIVSWRDSFTGVTSVHQQATTVYGALQDLCIDSQIVTYELPANLYDLYVEARQRAESGRTGTFSVAELIRAANNALREL